MQARLNEFYLYKIVLSEPTRVDMATVKHVKAWIRGLVANSVVGCAPDFVQAQAVRLPYTFHTAAYAMRRTTIHSPSTTRST